MKTFLLSLALAVSATAVADNLPQLSLRPLAGPTLNTRSGDDSDDSDDSDSASDMIFSYCGEPAGGAGGETGYYYGVAIQLSDAMVDKFAGCKIVGIQVATADYDTDKISTPQPLPINLFIAKNLNDASPLRSFSAQEDTSRPGEWAEYTLEDPYVIEAETPVYVGYKFQAVDDYYPVTADNTKHTGGEVGFMIGYSATSSTNLTWLDYSSYMGFACIRLHITGDNLPTDEVTVSATYVPTQVNLGNAIPVQLKLYNAASNAVNSVGVTYTVGDGPEQHTTVTLSSPMRYSNRAVATINVPYSGAAVDHLRLTATVDQVNDVSNNATPDTVSAYTQVFTLTDGFPRNVVVEEGTGTWCKWCVRGIVAMKTLSDTYPDGSFIPIAIHAAGSDPMAFSPYNYWAMNTFGGFPAAMVNRNLMEFGKLDPDTDNLTSTYLYTRTQLKSCANIDIANVKYLPTDSTRLLVTASTVYCFDQSDATYQVEFVLTENNVGPYYQTNGYAGGLMGEMGGWEDRASSVAWLYDDVARDVRTAYGVEGSVPTTLKAGRSYLYTDTISLERVTLRADGIRKTADCRIIALLINSTTGLIENAVSVDPADFIDVPAIPNESGAITEITADALTRSNSCYDLLGRPLAHPAPGQLYISAGRLFRN